MEGEKKVKEITFSVALLRKLIELPCAGGRKNNQASLIYQPNGEEKPKRQNRIKTSVRL